MPLYRPKSTIEQWRILQAVVDFGGYAQAGEALSKSQSSLNHAVSKLQHTLGVQLLEVKGRKAYLTKEGEVMLRRSRLLTQNVEELEQLAENMTAGWEPEITIACETIHPKEKLYSALEEFYPQARGTRVRIADEVLTGTKERILEHTADLVVVGGTIPRGYSGEKLETVTFVAYCGANHPLAQLDTVDIEELTHELQIVISDSSKHPEESQGWLKAEQRWTVSNFYQAIAILKRGTGFCWIPKHLTHQEVQDGNIVPVKLTSLGEKTVMTHLVTPTPNQLGPGATLLKNLILKQYK